MRQLPDLLMGRVALFSQGAASPQSGAQWKVWLGEVGAGCRASWCRRVSSRLRLCGSSLTPAFISQIWCGLYLVHSLGALASGPDLGAGFLVSGFAVTTYAGVAVAGPGAGGQLLLMEPLDLQGCVHRHLSGFPEPGVSLDA